MALLLDRGYLRLIGSINKDPNITAFMITPFIFYYLNYFEKSLIYKIGSFLSIIILILTFSRGAFISILPFIRILVFKNKKSKWTLLIFVTLLFFFYGDIVIERIKFIFLDGGSGRLQLWKNSFNIFLNNPIFGIGMNGTAIYNQINNNIYQVSHNTYLDILAEGGSISFSIWIIFILDLLRKIKSIKFLYYSLLSMCIQMIFLSLLFNESFYLLLIIIYKFLIDKEKIYKQLN